MFRRSLILCPLLLSALRAETPLASAQRLYRDQDYAAAAAAFTQILATEPQSAAACHGLGMSLRQRGDGHALDDAHPWLERAAVLAPDNEEYLGDLGGNCLELGSLHWAYGSVTRGRDIMEKVLRTDPSDVGAREGLMRFYREAPWPLGSREKAEAEAAEIARWNPRRGALAAIYLRRMAKDYAGALATALTARETYPNDYWVLFEVGRCASLADDNTAVEAGIAALQKCLQMKPPMDAPNLAAADFRLGMLWGKKGNIEAARAAYRAALERDPRNEPAQRALGQLP